MSIPKFLLIGSVLICSTIASPSPKPDVSEILSLPGLHGTKNPGAFYGTPLNEGWAAKVPKCEFNGNCVDLVNNMEYRPFITYNEQYYSVVEPEITTKRVSDPKIQTVDTEVPKIKEVLVPIRHVKETPKRRTLKKIKETVEPVYVNNHEITVERVPLKDPFIITQPILINDVKPQQATKVVTIPKPNVDRIRVKKYREVPNYIRKERTVVRFRPKYVNDTTIQYHRRRVEVPKIVYKTLTVTKPIIKSGGVATEVKTRVEKRSQQFVDEEPSFRPEHYTMDNVRKVRKEIKIPYKAPVQVARPEVLAVPVTIPVKEPYDVIRHVEQKQIMGIPCGHTKSSDISKTYLPADCPTCDSCQKCAAC